MLSSSRARTSVILAGKRDGGRPSTTSSLARMSQWRIKVFKCQKFYYFVIVSGLNPLQ